MSGEFKDGLARAQAPSVAEPLLPPPRPRQWWPVALTGLLAAVLLGGCGSSVTATDGPVAGDGAATDAPVGGDVGRDEGGPRPV